CVMASPLCSVEASRHLLSARIPYSALQLSKTLPFLIVVPLLFVNLGAANSAPPDFAQVPADTVWIVHADFDALRNSSVYKKLSGEALIRWKPLADRLAKVDRQLGMNLAKDLHGMTVFGPTLAESKAMLVMGADWDPKTFRQKLSLAPSHAT